MRLVASILAVALLNLAGWASATSILVVDPADTETGRLCEQIAAKIPNTISRRVQFASINEALGQHWNAVVWLNPEPTLYESIKPAWEKLLADKSTGLMFIGLPHDQPGRDVLIAAMTDRGGPTIGAHLSRHLEGCKWIWSAEKTSDNSRIFLRRKFELSSMPARAWIQIAADNRARVIVNESEVGVADDWRAPKSFDVTQLIRAGENVIAIDAFNEDGPAGVVMSLCARSDSGQIITEVISDESWKASGHAAADWQRRDFDETSWPPARAIAVLGGGPWDTSVRSDYGADEYVSTIARSAHPSAAGLSGEVGRLVVLDAMRAGNGSEVILESGRIPLAIAGEGPAGRAIVLGASPELATPAPGSPDVLASRNFHAFLGGCMSWLADQARPNEGAIELKGSAIDPLVIQPLAGSDRARFFPLTMQFTALPHDGVPFDNTFPTRPVARRRMIDNMIDHGVTVLQVPLQLPPEQAKDVERYAQARGMAITYYLREPIEGFARNEPPKISLYSPEYPDSVRARLQRVLPALQSYPRLLNAFLFQDEPFHAGEKSFGNSDEEIAEFRRQFGYELPASLEAIDGDPKKTLDVLNFRSGYFPVGWRQAYALIKQSNPRFDVILNHDSHNTLGGAVQQEGKIAVDDVFHWGSDFADVLAFDIYPYLMTDFRYGPDRKLKLPRMSQTHFALAQMRNLCYTGAKRMGFWVGTYNPEWYSLTPEGRSQYWMEREMAYTAIAHGADYLIGGIGVPIDQRHWDDFGESMRTIQKCAPELLKTKKLRAGAAMLFPRTQMLLCQEEYWNVAQSYEAFLRAFGELDVIHEDQLASGDALDAYRALVIFDVKLLPRAAAERVARFVEKGGMLIADCVPMLDENLKPLPEMMKIFGVTDAGTGRILWKITRKPDDNGRIEETPATRPVQADGDRVRDIPLVSPRPFNINRADVLLKTQRGIPALTASRFGDGRAYLLGFCFQDTMFEAFRSNDAAAQRQLLDLLREITESAGLRSHVRSSNPQIEAAVRAGEDRAFLFVINHESTDPLARIVVSDPGFDVAGVRDVATNREVAFQRDGRSIALDVQAPLGSTMLLELRK